MRWFHRKASTVRHDKDSLEQLAPRSTLLPPAPAGMPNSPRTMRAPICSPPQALRELDVAVEEMAYDDFAWDLEEDERPTKRWQPFRPAAPTLRCRFA
ncbi:MAG: hypothetical protein BWY17_02193 [Deltaproteobacteria bacterium ADurb.Bin207]|nr:MAG: hypothetical protein BWY17_02193 [Deltaproteobacteria bacterium ADurb.Bin207]